VNRAFRFTDQKERAIMGRLKKHVIGILAAATVAAAGLTAPAPASAMPISCVIRIAVAVIYIATGDMYNTMGAYTLANHWYNKAENEMDGCR
jgi:hypothetical protein